ncbi:MAG: ABC transporter permease, partial [Bacilli bacterium]|nr:ABC transporter permease [Bacilli bacterium]
MIVFKTFWKVVKKYKGMIFLYTALLLLFGGLNTKSNDTSLNFVDSKPDVMIVNEDVDGKITKNLVDYLKNHTNVVEEKKTEEEILDAIFYREVNYVIYIPKNYGSDVMNQNDPSVTIRSTGDYQASLASMLLERYLKTQDVFVKNDMSEEEIIKSVNEVLQTQVEVSITSQLDANELNQVTQYFNFASYTLMAVVIFIVCLVLSSFHESKVSRRIQVSKMDYRKHNSFIILASSFYTMMVFVLFGVLGFVLFGHTLLSYRGLLYLFNAFLFLFVSLTLAVLISNLVHNKEAVSGIVNVVALGSAF